MTGLAIRYPEAERYGVLRIPTTRGDRLFLSLLGAAFIHLAWIGLVGVGHDRHAARSRAASKFRASGSQA